MSTQTNGRWLAILAAATLAAGCATTRIERAYKGAERTPAELALVWGSTNSALSAIGPGGERIYIESVDDDATVPWYSFSSLPRAVQVLPGRHKIGARYEYIHGYANGFVFVDALAGHTYQVKVLNPGQRTERVFFLIQDTTAQTVVGGSEKQAKQ